MDKGWPVYLDPGGSVLHFVHKALEFPLFYYFAGRDARGSAKKTKNSIDFIRKVW